ncbi:MAG: nicotinate-nucleotide--dimethylbenzimidazole phosphoribosyltransferase [Lachnospiraceae bacterium]|nr:nicotinate-nucleotide--dimethylbenzimidazole phosphoribosyltransferase [Lachnospiraceae bacterium]
MTLKELENIRISRPDRDIYEKAKKRFDLLAKPIDGLGNFEDLICRIAGIRNTLIPDISQKALVIMCADNGVTEENISQSDKSVTFKVAELLGQDLSTVCKMRGNYPLDIITVDVGIDSDETPKGVIDKKVRKGTGNILKEPAMTAFECLKAIETGIEMMDSLSKKGYGIVATGEMGIGNTTTSTALYCALTGNDPKDIAGRGAGLSDEGLERKICVIEKVLKKHKVDSNDPFNALRILGGLDIAALTGLYIGGALNGIPVVSDGFISILAAFVASLICPGTEEYVIPSHLGREKGSGMILKSMGLKAVIDGDMALGEGTGAIMMLPLLDMAMNLYREGTFFDDTKIGSYVRFENDNVDNRKT